jgi:spermidine synthase
MQKISESLSRLFAKEPTTVEARRIEKLEKLQKKHQGKPFFFDEGNLRFMYFSQMSVQSAMKIDSPNELLCGYTSAMLAFLLANPNPQHILMIGLGGGSQVKFCHHHLPQCKITVLEIDADVIALRKKFMIPPDDDRLEIIQANALTYMTQHSLNVDVILLDGFDINGLVEELNTKAFYTTCHQALKPNGILVANMWGKRKQLVSLLSELRTLFEQRVWWCRSLDSYNLLVFSFKEDAATFTNDMSAQAKALDQKLSLKFTELCSQMRTLHLPFSTKFNASGEYEIKELVRLTADMAELMVADETLASGDVEWSEIHQ